MLTVRWASRGGDNHRLQGQGSNPAACPWPSHLLFPSLHFLTCKIKAQHLISKAPSGPSILCKPAHVTFQGLVSRSAVWPFYTGRIKFYYLVQRPNMFMLLTNILLTVFPRVLAQCIDKLSSIESQALPRAIFNCTHMMMIVEWVIWAQTS